MRGQARGQRLRQMAIAKKKTVITFARSKTHLLTFACTTTIMAAMPVTLAFDGKDDLIS